MPQARGRDYCENIGLKTDVSVKDVIVTLRGDAASEAQKELTTEYAKDVTGVKDVKKEMTVTESK
jgi:osmotically-inducible protein OsmY